VAHRKKGKGSEKKKKGRPNCIWKEKKKGERGGNTETNPGREKGKHPRKKREGFQEKKGGDSLLKSIPRRAPEGKGGILPQEKVRGKERFADMGKEGVLRGVL